MSSQFRPRAEDPDIRDQADASLAQGQQQVEQVAATPSEEADTATGIEIRKQQLQLNETKRAEYEANVRAAAARRKNQPSAEAWKQAASSSKGDGRAFAAQAAAEAARDQSLIEDSGIRLQQDAINSQRESESIARAEDAAAARQQTIDTRLHAANGGETITDPATGRSTIATHPDGAPKFKAGPIDGEAPRTQDTAEKAIAGIPGMGDAASLMYGDRTRQQEVVQPMRNDRGQTADVPLEQKTDPKTGEIYSETKDEFGQPQRVSLGTDPVIPQVAKLKGDIDRTAADLQASEITRMQIEPRWKQVESDYHEQKRKMDAPSPFMQVDGKWVDVKDQVVPTDPAEQRAWAKKQFPADPEKLALWQRQRQTDEPAWRSARTRYEQERGTWENLQGQIQGKKLAKEKLELQKTRLELGLPEQDGGTAEIILTTQTGERVTDQKVVQDYIASLPTDERMRLQRGLPTQPGSAQQPASAPTPLIPQGDPAALAAFSQAFGGIVKPEELTIGAKGDGYAFIQRGGTNIGSLETDPETQTPRFVIDSRFAPADILQQVTLGKTAGFDIYLRDPLKPIRPRQEAEWAASVFKAASTAPPEAIASVLNSMGAGPEQIAAKVKAGELSVKRGEALMKDLWGSTFQVDDAADKPAFEKWITTAPRETKTAWFQAVASQNTDAKNTVMRDYLDEWQARNSWKPGFTLAQRVNTEKALKLTPSTTEQIAGMADTFAITAIQSVSMLSQLLSPIVAPAAYVVAPEETAKWAGQVGRATANDTRMFGRSAQRYATKEGVAAFVERDAIGRDLQAAIMSQDNYVGGKDNPEWKAAMDAVIRRSTDNADKIHGWNREDGWEITREDIDPATNENLRKLIDTAAATGNWDLAKAFMASQLEDHGTRQASKYNLDLAAGRNKYVAAAIQGAHSSLWETGTEVISDVVSLGAGRVLFGAGKAATAAKAAGQLAKLEQAATAGSRLAKLRLAMHGVKTEFIKAGMVADTLASPASKLGKLQNAGAKALKFTAATMPTGAAEEGVMGFANPDASPRTVLHDALLGAVMEPLLGGLMATPVIAADSIGRKMSVSRATAKFTDAYNREFNSAEGFTPLTPAKAQAALALFDSVNLNIHASRLAESSQSLMDATRAAAADGAGTAEVQAMHAAQAAHREAIDAISESVFSRIEAVQHVESVEPAQRPLAYAVAKVAAGRADLVTPSERQAAAAAVTTDGSPVFATDPTSGTDTLTPQGRAFAMEQFPTIGMLIQTVESEQILAQQLEPQAPDPAAFANPDGSPLSNPFAVPQDQAAAPDNVSDTPNVERAPVTPEQQQQAAAIAAQVMQEVTAEAPAIAARVVPGKGTVRVSGGVTASVGADGAPRINLIEDDIAHSLAVGMDPAQLVARLKDNIILHETLHSIQFSVAEQQQRAAGDTTSPAEASQTFYREMHAQMATETPQMLENGRALYAEQDDGSAPQWDTLPEWAQAAEVVRMLAEAKLAGRTTDVSRLLDGASPSLLAKLAQIVKDMIAAITTGESIPESVRQHVDTLAELYNQLLNATPSPTNTRSPNLTADPSQSAPSQTSDGNGPPAQAGSDSSAPNHGGTQPSPSDNAGPPAAPAEDAARVKATAIVRAEFDKALAARPLLKKDAALMDGLREAAIDIVAAFQGRPQAEIQDAAARAIGTYLQSPEVSEKLGQIYAAQSAKAKSYRAAAAARVNAEAARVIGQRMATVRDLTERVGRITRPTNALELYRTGQTLPPEWNGMLRASDYQGGGKNAVARAILSQIYAPDSDSGLSPDQAANGLSRELPDKYDQFTPDLLWTALETELRGYLQGADTSNLDDPDADTSGMTDAQIQAMVDRSAKAATVEKWRGITGKSLLPATTEAYEAEYQAIVAAEGENDFLDEDYQARAIAAVDERNKPKPKAEAPPAAKPETAPIPDDGSIFAAIENGNEVDTTPTPSVLERIKRWISSMPGFQGGKKEMAAPVTAAIEKAFSPERRAHMTKAVDFFGGGGNWGIFNALTSFPNIKDMVLYERNSDRILKIKLFHEKGNQVGAMLQLPNVRAILESAAESMRQDQVKSGSALARRINTSGISDPLLLGLFQAIRDYAENSFAGATDAEGNQTPEQKIATSLRIVSQQAADAYKAADAFRQRGGTITYRNGDSYKASAEQGDDVVSFIDPPYYLTKGYSHTESAPDMFGGQIEEDVTESIVGDDTYAKTRDLIQRSAQAGNSIIYTDSAWWKTSSGSETPYFDLPASARRLFRPAGRQILSDIVDLFDSFGVVGGEIGAGRKEILGIHGHDITTQPGRRTRPQRNARNNEGQGSPDGRNDQPAGRGDDPRQAVPGLAEGTAGETGPLRSEPGDPLNDSTLGSAAPQGMNGRPAIQTADGRTLEAPGAVLMSPAPQAYHGTPHKVDKFTTSKIGTGEGAQAYGYGLYFAERKHVAEYYKNTLGTTSRAHVKIDGKRMNAQAARKMWGSHPDEAIRRSAEEMSKHLTSTRLPEHVLGRIDDHRQALEQMKKGLAQRIAPENAENIFSWTPEMYQDRIDYEETVIARLEKFHKLVEVVPEKKNANLYTVRIKPDTDELLEWDKPVDQMSESTQRSLAEVLQGFKQKWPNVDPVKQRGETIYGHISEKLSGKDGGRNDKAASKLLSELGIRGIRYTDGSSRNMTQPVQIGSKWQSTANGQTVTFDKWEDAVAHTDSQKSYNYVIFDEADIEITEENGKPVHPSAALFSSPVQADRAPTESGQDYYARITQAPVVRFEQSRIVHHQTGAKSAAAITSGGFKSGKEVGLAEKRGGVYFADEDVNPGIYARTGEDEAHQGQQARTLPIDIRGLTLLNNEYAPDQGYPNHKQYGNNRIRGEFDMLPPGVDGYISFLDDGRIYEVAIPAEVANQARQDNRLFSPAAQSAQTLHQSLLDSIGEQALRVEQPGKSYEDKKQLLLDFANSLLPEQSAPAVPEANLQGLRAIRQRVAATVATDLRVNFIGETIEGLEDLVEKAQVLRNPGFETFYVLATRVEGGKAKVLDAMAVTSRVPLSSAVFDNNKGWSEGIKGHAEFLRNAGADSYILIHNHPSGDPSPSGADIRVTREHASRMDKLGFELIDHVVINHLTYATLDANGAISRGRIQSDAVDPHAWPVGTEIGMEADGPAKIAAIAKNIQEAKERPGLLVGFFLNSDLKVVASVQGSAQDIKNITLSQLQEIGRRQGGHMFVLHGQAANRKEALSVMRELAPMNQAGILTDVIMEMIDTQRIISGEDVPFFVQSETGLFSEKTPGTRVQNPSAQYRYLKDKEAKAGLTPAEQQALLQAEKSMGQSFALDMDDPALQARKGSVSPSFQPQLNLQREHPVTGQQLALFAPAAQQSIRHAALEAKHNAGTITPAETAEATRITQAKARESGHTVKAYHGAPRKIEGNKFDRSRIGMSSGVGRDGFSFTTNKRAAEAYSAGFSKGEETVQWWAHEVNKILSTIPEDSEAEIWGMPAFESLWDTGAMDIDDFSIEGIPANIRETAEEIREVEPEAANKLDELSRRKPERTTGGKLYGTFLKLNNPRTVEASVEKMAEELWGVRASRESDVIVELDDGEIIYYVYSPESIKSADPFTGVPLSQRFNPASDSILRSPAAQPNDATALEDALRNLAPIYLDVLQASQATPTPTPADLARQFSLPERAIANIIGTARTRIMAHGRTIRPGGLTPARTADGRLKGGMPQRANSTNPHLAAVDQIQQQEGLPLGMTEREIIQGGDRIASRPDALGFLLASFSDGQRTAAAINATHQYLNRANLRGEQSPQLTELAILYREEGTRRSDEFRARKDLHYTPAERNAKFFQDLLTAPNKRVMKAYSDARTPQEKSAVLEAWNAKVKGIKDAMKARGIDLDTALRNLAEHRNAVTAAEQHASGVHQKLVDGLNAEVARLQAQLAAAQDQAAKDTAQTQLDQAQERADEASSLDPANTIRLELQKLTAPQRVAIETIRDGGTWEQAASNSFMPVPEVKRTFDQFADALDTAGMKAILLAEDILLQQQARLGSPAANAMSREDRARQAAAGIRKALGYDRALIDRRSSPAPKPGKGGARKTTTRPEPAAMSDAQFQAYLDNPQTWRPLWQAEATLTQESLTFEQWIAKPETRALRQTQEAMFKQPVSTTTGALDMHDPDSVKRAYDSFNIHSASLFDKALEFWRTGILSGPQTAIVNFGGNIAHSLYQLGPRRILEAGVNDALGIIGMGSKDAATLGELRIMSRQIHQALAKGGIAMMRSWQIDDRLVESEVLAQGKQMEFGGIGADYMPRALGGTLGDIMHGISFRHMTASDEMIKSFHSHMEVAAFAYRMARAEGLRGDAMESRIAGLMAYGSPAWKKAMTSAKWVTFQTEMAQADRRSISILDRLAKGVRRLSQTDTGRTREIINGEGKKVTVPVLKPNAMAFFFPFILTPLNIFKIGIEMSPVGAMFSLIDATRALKERMDKGHLSPESAKAAAAELYNKQRLVSDVTNQVVAAGMFWALGALVKPGDDDDDDLPVITGSVDWKRSSKADRDLRARVMPAYSIRIGDKIFSYQRVEPFGTALGFLIDMRLAVDKHGMSDAALGEFMATAINQMDNKTYMQGISDLINFIHDPERVGTKMTGSIATAFVPNLIRQPIREVDPFVRDTTPAAEDGLIEGVTKRILYSVAPGYAPPQVDVWGRPLLRNPGQTLGSPATDVVLRIFDPSNLTIGRSVDPIDRYLFNWNNSQSDPKDRFNVEPIRDTLQVTRNGQTRKLAIPRDEADQANIRAGHAARELLGNQWDTAKPTAQGVERITDVLRKFQKRERDQLREKYAATLPAE